MQTLFEAVDQTLNNRDLRFSNRTAVLAAGSHILFRLRVTDINPGSTMLVVMDVTFPGGNVKHFEMLANAVGSQERGGWAGIDREGVISASGTVTVEGRITFDAYVVTFERGEDVLEWQ